MIQRVPFNDLHVTDPELRREMDHAIARVVDSGWFLLGTELREFESEFARATEAEQCVGVGSGLDALILALRALGVGKGDEVIVPTNTYVATWLAVTAVGATIVPVEPDPLTLEIAPAGVADAMSGRTRVVMPVHLYGGLADLDRINSIAHEGGAQVVVDAAQAHGARLGDRELGAQGDVVAWSFYPTKNLGALADAGAITTDDESVADAVRVLRNYGSRTKYVNECLGMNSRLDELQAAILRVKLSHLTEWTRRRREQAMRYLDAFADLPLQLPKTIDGGENAYHLFTVLTEDRAGLREYLDGEGVETLVHYPVPPHLQPAYEHLGFGRGSFPISETIHEQIFSLPIGPHLSDPQVAVVIDAVVKFHRLGSAR